MSSETQDGGWFERRGRAFFVLAGVLLAVTSVYSNHFQNGFHFDDAHTVENNVYIRDVRHIPSFFADAATFSTLVDHREYRPLVTASLAFDYWLAGGLDVKFFFHLSTFIVYLGQLALMFFLFRRIMQQRAAPALFAVAWYGLHPVSAETVNYVVQRGDVYSTAGVVAGILAYAVWRGGRRWRVYLIPVILGALAKPSALVFPALLFCYVLLFEEEAGFEVWKSKETLRKWGHALRRVLPAVVLCSGLFALHHCMTPHVVRVMPSFSGWRYIVSQPYIALHYARSLLLPTELSADTDWEPVASAGTTPALVGYVFLALVCAWACRASRRPEERPIAFGLAWYFIALLPTALIPMSEVMNDHRMFFPFIGLVAAVVWWGYLQLARFPRPAAAAAAALACASLPIYGYGAHQRNEVWRTEETLWRDVTLKSPRNGRGLMNYGLTQMAKGELAQALHYFERAKIFNPNYGVLEINLGIVKGALNRHVEAESHFFRALQLNPERSESYFYYARWLRQQARGEEAIPLLEHALRLNQHDFSARHLLLDLYNEHQRRPELRRVAEETIRLMPSDALARRYLEQGSPPG